MLNANSMFYHIFISLLLWIKKLKKKSTYFYGCFLIKTLYSQRHTLVLTTVFTIHRGFD
jgi:hypothetical protein